MTTAASTSLPVVFLFDVDDTLLDNDTAQDEYKAHMAKEYGQRAADRYWQIFHEVFKELDYADYLGALQRYRLEDLHNPHLLLMSSYLLDYPFTQRLYPRALDVLGYIATLGQTAILSDGDVIFQPRKIDRSGICAAVQGRVLIYVHKEDELADVERFYPASHYVLIDDKLRVLSVVKSLWGSRVTTVWPKQGHYANDPQITGMYPAADIAVDHIADLLNYSLADFLNAAKPKP